MTEHAQACGPHPEGCLLPQLALKHSDCLWKTQQQQKSCPVSNRLTCPLVEFNLCPCFLEVTLQWCWHLQLLHQFWEAQLLPRQSSSSTIFSLRLCLLQNTGFSVLWIRIYVCKNTPGDSDQLLNCVQLFETPRAVNHQVPLSMAFSRQEYWSRLPFLPPRDLPNPRIEPASTVSAGGFFTTETASPQRSMQDQ